ncbi:MAG TPA: hypothetical protein VE553_08200 [Candidatus Binatia bacterium]|nr:hypothetical protein [Candidatus Binatia bacterium]
MLQLPTLFEWIQRLEPLRGAPSAYLALLTAAVIVIAWDWRLALAALTVQYFAAGILFLDVLDARLSIIKLLVGWFICIMLYLTARQVNWGRLPEDVPDEEAVQWRRQQRVRFGPYLLPSNAPFRVFLVLLFAVAMLTLAQRQGLQLPAVSEPMNLAILAMAGMGLLGLGLTTEPLKAGMSLLTFMTGFELFYNSLEQSVAMLVFLAAANLILALTVSYLTQTRHALPALFQHNR